MNVARWEKIVNHRMNVSETLCLKWDDFKDGITSSFADLRKGRDLTDVTLACEDGQQVEAHKVILAASSPFFLDLLKKNRHPHPLIYMRGFKSEMLSAMLDFLYFGEANVLEENLDSFLGLADELTLTGLTGTDRCKEGSAAKIEPSLKKASLKKEKLQQSEKYFGNEYLIPTEPNTVVALDNNTSNANLDEKIKSMMTTADVRSSDGHKLSTCNICGKEAPSNKMPSHIEAKHITGVSHSCNICGKSSRSREALRKHKHTYHHATMLQDEREFEDAHA